MTEHAYSSTLALTAFAASVVVVHVIGLQRRSRKNTFSKLKSAGTSSDTLASTVASDENDMSVHLKDFIIDYIPGEYMPGCPPDSVVKYYCKDTINDPSFQEVPRAIDPKDQGTPDEWVSRHPDLVRLTGRHPFNCEAPLKQLYAKGFITPTSLHYVRNHGAAPKITWEDHVVYLGGLVPKRIKLKMRDIVALPSYSLPVLLVCCGNRRKEQNMIKQTKGFNWGAAGLSNGVWTGCRLSTLLRLAGINSVDDFPQGMHIRFASESDLGGDKLPSGVYGTSVPLEKALDDSQDIMIAWMYNGKLLTPDHGFPVRVIIPGYIGGRMIKWLTNIDLIDTISQDYYHFFDNRVLPPHVDAELAMAEGWWYKPEYICNDLNVNSAIAVPDHDEELQLVKGQKYLCQGYAYTGGGRKITRVEVSLNSGAMWRLTTLKFDEKPTRYGKYWCWMFWEIELAHEDLAGAEEMVLRAWDEGHAVQPDKPTWNLMGMLNNPWFRIKIHPMTASTTPSLNEGTHENEVLPRVKFEHPTMAGNVNGGWMMRMKEHPSLVAPGVYNDHYNDHVKGGQAVDVTDVSTTAITDKPPPTVFDPSKPSFSMEEVQHHADNDSAWIVVNDKVFDCTPFLKDHPGGKESILISAGTECTEEFEAIHSKKAWKMLDDYYIGQLRPDGVSDTTTSATTTTTTTVVRGGDKLIALDPKKRIPFTLAKRVQLSPDSLLLRFSLQSPQHILGLPVGKHMFFSAKIDGKLAMRAYTPTSSDHDIGIFDLVIKVYSPTAQYPLGGIMSQYLGNLKVGESIDVKGPLGHVNYLGKGVMMLDEDKHTVKKFACLCGGTGITPIYQILCAVLRDPNDTTELFVIDANRNEVDILLRDELDMLAKAHPTRLHLHHILSGLSSGSEEEQKWLKGAGGAGTASRSVGRVGKELVSKMIPQGGSNTGCYALLCGPPDFLTKACDPALEAIGYNKDSRIYF